VVYEKYAIEELQKLIRKPKNQKIMNNNEIINRFHNRFTKDIPFEIRNDIEQFLLSELKAFRKELDIAANIADIAANTADIAANIADIAANTEGTRRILRTT
jgi:hypothetical protein